MDCVAWQRRCHNMPMSCQPQWRLPFVLHPALSCVRLGVTLTLSFCLSLYHSTFTIRPVTLEHSFGLSCACQLAAKSVLFPPLYRTASYFSCSTLSSTGQWQPKLVDGWFCCCYCILWSCHRSQRNSMHLLGACFSSSSTCLAAKQAKLITSHNKSELS